MLTLPSQHPYDRNCQFSSVAEPRLGLETPVAFPDTAFFLPHHLFLDVTSCLHQKELPDPSGKDDGKDLLG